MGMSRGKRQSTWGRVARAGTIRAMNLKPVLMALGVAVVVGLAWKTYGLQGLLFALGAVVMWWMINVNRTMSVMRKAANRPIGYVSSAVMLNARMKPKSTLLNVVAMTQSMGQLLSPQGEQPEVYRWTDASESSVTGTFMDGKLQSWELTRPVAQEAATPAIERAAQD